MKTFVCVSCGHTIYTNADHPMEYPWSDGHRCSFREVKKPEPVKSHYNGETITPPPGYEYKFPPPGSTGGAWVVTCTGGGCEAFTRAGNYGAKDHEGFIMITDWDGCDLPRVERGDCLIGFYNEDGEMIGSIRVPYADVLSGKISIS